MAIHKNFKTKNGTELPILDMRGKPYLQVAHRIVWFREENPTWKIQTSLSFPDAKTCISRAEIRNEEGEIMATAHKREDEKGFFDYIEKAETGSIGRALALVGYGTQFCADELDEGARLADSPIDAVSKPQPQKPQQPRPQAAVPGIPSFANFNSKPMSENDIPF